jgi:hypothetical protein
MLRQRRWWGRKRWRNRKSTEYVGPRVIQGFSVLGSQDTSLRWCFGLIIGYIIGGHEGERYRVFSRNEGSFKYFGFFIKLRKCKK